MAREITVHVGTSVNAAGVKHPAAWVKTAITLEPEPYDLMNAVASKYIRHDSQGDDEVAGDRPKDLPESLTQAEILKAYREELLHYGDEVMGMWGDEMGAARRNACEKWVYEVVLNAFPAMRGYEL